MAKRLIPSSTTKIFFPSYGHTHTYNSKIHGQGYSLQYWGVLVVKNLPAIAGDAGDTGSIPGLGRYPGGGNGNSLQYSYLENTMDRGAWRATVHGVTGGQWVINSISFF